jgi:hypothetical protein
MDAHLPPVSPHAIAVQRAEGDPHGAFVQGRDADGSVRITAQGSWLAEEIDRHFVALDNQLRAIRASGGRARVLVDLRQAPVQADETAARLQRWTGRIYAAEDKVAILVGSSLLKAQMRQLPMAARRELFLSEGAALQWLAA